jgi:hypothetical protein
MKFVGTTKYTLIEVKIEEMSLLTKLLRLDDKTMKGEGFSNAEITLSHTMHRDILKYQ